MHEGRHLLPSFNFHESNSSGDSGCLQDTASIAADRGVRVVVSDDDFFDSGPHQSFRARWRAPKMIARLKGDVGCCAVGRQPPFFGVMNGHLFCMQPTKMVVATLGNNGPVLDQDATNQRIGADFPSATLSDQEGMLHEHAINLCPFSAHAHPTNLLFKIACMRAMRS